MKVGDLVNLKSVNSLEMGLVVYKHPTKEVVQVFWADIGFNWESCARLCIMSSYE